jgi:hypothetical protein
MGPVGQRAGQLALDFLGRSVGLHDQLARHGMNADLDFHGAPLPPGQPVLTGPVLTGVVLTGVVLTGSVLTGSVLTSSVLADQLSAHCAGSR